MCAQVDSSTDQTECLIYTVLKKSKAKLPEPSQDQMPRATSSRKNPCTKSTRKVTKVTQAPTELTHASSDDLMCKEVMKKRPACGDTNHQKRNSQLCPLRKLMAKKDDNPSLTPPDQTN